MDCPKCGTSMGVKSTRRLARNPQVVRRRRRCEACGTSFQTEERPRLLITRTDEREPFLRGVLFASLVSAADECDPPMPENLLRETVRRVVVNLLAEGTHAPSADEIQTLTGRTLIDQGLEAVAYRYDPSLNPDSFLVEKRGGRSREPFSRDKLKRSIEAAAMDHLLDAEAIDGVVDEIEGEIGGTSITAPIGTAQLRALVSGSLRRRDERAFLRYVLGGPSSDETLSQLLDRVAPAAQVLKRDGAAVLFDVATLTKSIRRSFLADRRESRAGRIAAFVAVEERRVRE